MTTVPRPTFAPNGDGRDLVLGDVHGCFDTVEGALGRLAYDAGRDRLFSLGDLIDHGARSADALEWIQTHLTATVRGNHEDMMLDYLRIAARLHNDGGAWRHSPGSDWFPTSTGDEERQAWRAALEALPLTVTVQLRPVR